MRDFEHCINVLERVAKEGIPFSLAINSSLKKEKRLSNQDLRDVISYSCGGVLRHYFALIKNVQNAFPELDERNQLIIVLLLSNKLFSKKIDEEKLLAFAKKETNETTLSAFLDKYQTPADLIPSDVKVDSVEYFHLKCNLPIWLINMWKKNLGETLSAKLFKTFAYKGGQVFRIDQNKNSQEEFLKKYPEFLPLDLQGLVSIKDKVNKKSLSALRNEDAIDMYAGYTYMLKDIELDIFRGIAVYNGSNNNILDELYARLGTYLKFDYLCGNQSQYLETKKKIQKYGITDLSIYECGYSAIRTCISKPVHLFFVSPENSSYQRILEKSDYFLSINPEQLDEYIKIEREVLNEAAELVEEGGYIVYSVPTICRNETYGLIEKFLKEHKDYKLVEQRQLLPFDKYRSMLYFAILQKEIINHD